ncbi:hypothetical protein LCGC14_2719090, partial [marine sediment metagenome]
MDEKQWKELEAKIGTTATKVFSEKADEFRAGLLTADQLKTELEETFDIIIPKMPNPNNAKYNEWKIWFEKLLPFLRDNIVLIGHSLGGIFLVKYLSENDFPKKIRATYLIAPPYDDKNSEYSLNDFVLPKNLKKLSTQGGNVFIYHSEDDPVVTFIDAKKYKEQLPRAKLYVFK